MLRVLATESGSIKSIKTAMPMLGNNIKHAGATIPFKNIPSIIANIKLIFFCNKAKYKHDYCHLKSYKQMNR
jgi:hypothetical protein